MYALQKYYSNFTRNLLLQSLILVDMKCGTWHKPPFSLSIQQIKLVTLEKLGRSTWASRLFLYLRIKWPQIRLKLVNKLVSVLSFTADLWLFQSWSTKTMGQPQKPFPVSYILILTLSCSLGHWKSGQVIYT